jgi:hypothetical protein
MKFKVLKIVEMPGELPFAHSPIPVSNPQDYVGKIGTQTEQDYTVVELEFEDGAVGWFIYDPSSPDNEVEEV